MAFLWSDSMRQTFRLGKTKFRVTRKFDLVKREFDVVESFQDDKPGTPTILVFQPRQRS